MDSNLLSEPPREQRYEVERLQEHQKHPTVLELKPFKEELVSIISNIKYKPASNQFQDQMKEDKAKIARTEEVIVKADKTANLYKMKIEEHRKKMSENITKDYKKANKSKVDKVISEAAKIAWTHNLEDRMNIPTESPVFFLTASPSPPSTPATHPSTTSYIYPPSPKSNQ